MATQFSILGCLPMFQSHYTLGSKLHASTQAIFELREELLTLLAKKFPFWMSCGIPAQCL
jgi:hypothetical protein